MSSTHFIRAALAWLIYMASLWATHVQAAPVLSVANGILTGATGVVVNGVSYDVSFLDGSCPALYSGCNEASDFPFATAAQAAAASQALIEGVLIDGPAGQFDSNPELTRGCSNLQLCDVATPHGLRSDPSLGGIQVLDISFAVNSPINTIVFPGVLDPGTDSTGNEVVTFALWNPSAITVSEPDSLALLAAASVALSWMQRRRRRFDA